MLCLTVHYTPPEDGERRVDDELGEKTPKDSMSGRELLLFAGDGGV